MDSTKTTRVIKLCTASTHAHSLVGRIMPTLVGRRNVKLNAGRVVFTTIAHSAARCHVTLVWNRVLGIANITSVLFLVDW